MKDTATFKRKTGETDIEVSIDRRGGEISVLTGIGFFDHMLTSLAFHAGWGLSVRAKGDLETGAHHTVEDTGICLGAALRDLLEDKSGLARFGEATIPMDDALAQAAADIGGRPYLVVSGAPEEGGIGGYDFALTEEFFRALINIAGITMHLTLLNGHNAHHMTEALFKAAGRALRAAMTEAPGVLSTKGSI